MSDVDGQLLALARERFGWSTLSGPQLSAMRRLVDGRDVVCVLPTGSGKSAIYELPALLLSGPTVVVSPLVALQQDQVQALDGIVAARRLSGITPGQQRRALADVVDGAARLVYV